MDEKKFCFICCVNNKQYYNECLYYINNLNVPIGYEIEVISIEDSKGMTEGYNRAMNSSNAKYKIYLHQDTMIINENFLNDILFIFEKDKNIGMIGMIGSKTIPVYAQWWLSENKYGKVYESSKGKLEELDFKEVESSYEEVKIVDGLIIITQYDINWREDIFDAYHFYDVSQSTEFIKKGLKVVVPKQERPWIIHDCGMANLNGYFKYRDMFLEEYYKEVLPLVSIVIPAINNSKKINSLDRLIKNQEYKNVEVYIDKENKNLDYLENLKGSYIYFSLDGDLSGINDIQKTMNHFIDDLDNQISYILLNSKISNENCETKKENNLDEQINVIYDKRINIEDLSEILIKRNKKIVGDATAIIIKKDNYKK
jgi:hypothetical protein